MTKPRIAIVLFNMGGPDEPDAVEPFLFNLFNDPAIIGLPNPFRHLLARLISRKRAPLAKEIYQHLGGSSPILPLTQLQAKGLKDLLNEEWETEVFIAMRYWHPFSDDVVINVKAFAPDHIIALPLYPQFSTTTTASSFKDWKRAAKKIKLDVPTSFICCYPDQENFITAHAELIAPVYQEAKKYGIPRILFSAHGLPEKIIKAGDPYQWQVERTTKAIMSRLVSTRSETMDYLNTYQSRVGPLQWIKPATDDEIRRAGAENIPLVIVPVAFVSEHSETLVELDIEYGKLAEESNVPFYGRVPALSNHPLYMRALAKICRDNLAKKVSPHICPENYKKCYCANLST